MGQALVVVLCLQIWVAVDGQWAFFSCISWHYWVRGAGGDFLVLFLRLSDRTVGSGGKSLDGFGMRQRMN